MKMTLVDKGECFRAFLILVGRDSIITKDERALLIGIGKMLDFERQFCETAIDDLLENRYINTTAPLFSHQEIARAFLKDAIRIAFVDADFHSAEVEWLESIAKKNDVSADWLADEIVARELNGGKAQSRFQIEQYAGGRC